jgi:hypothetical protein
MFVLDELERQGWRLIKKDDPRESPGIQDKP